MNTGCDRKPMCLEYKFKHSSKSISFKLAESKNRMVNSKKEGNKTSGQLTGINIKFQNIQFFFASYSFFLLSLPLSLSPQFFPINLLTLTACWWHLQSRRLIYPTSPMCLPRSDRSMVHVGRLTENWFADYPHIRCHIKILSRLQNGIFRHSLLETTELCQWR